MGFALQSFPPRAQPYAVSGVCTLLAVGRQHWVPRPGLPRNAPEGSLDAGRTYARPAKQPPSSGCCSTRESAIRSSGLDGIERVALLGLLPSRALTPHRDGTAYTAPPLLRLARPTQATFGLHFRVSLPARSVGLSRDYRPSWGFLPPDSSRRCELDLARESPPRTSGYVTAPCRVLFEPWLLPYRSPP